MAKQLLLTGFEPFGGETVNPSWEAVSRLPTQLGDWHIHKLQLPVVFGTAADLLWEAAKDIRPDGILCIGQAGGRAGITPEQVAINLRNGTDNAGIFYQDAPVIPDGPAAYFATLPVRNMVQSLEKAGIAAAVSYSAGTYVCNDTLYTLLHRCAGTKTRVGFLHIPYLPQQAKNGAPSLPLPELVRALEQAILGISC